MESLFSSLVVTLQQELEVCSDSARRSAVSCRLALLCWDLVGDLAAVERWLSHADSLHPQAFELQRQLLLEKGDAEHAAALLATTIPDSSGDIPASASGLRLPLALEAVLLRLLWLRDFHGAATLCRQFRGRQVSDPQLGDVAGLAMSLADDTEGLLELVAESPAQSQALVRAGLALWDRNKQAEPAATLLQPVHAADEADLYLVELLLELTVSHGRLGSRLSLLEKKLELLSLHDPNGGEARATAMQLARLLLDSGETQRAARFIATVDPEIGEADNTRPEHHSPLRWSIMLLLEARRDLAAGSLDCQRLATAYLRLAEATSVPAMARVYSLRAAELLALDPGGASQAESLMVHSFAQNPADPHSARALEEHRLRYGHLEKLCQQYQDQAAACPELRGLLLRKAAMVAEGYQRDRSLAAGLRREGLAHQQDPSGLGDLQRHYRALGSDPRLIDAYAREADSSTNPDLTSLLHSEVAVLYLKLDQLQSAESAAREALRDMAADPLALEVLCLVYANQGRTADLRWALEQKATNLASPVNRVTALRQLAQLAEDPSAAMETLLVAYALQPENSDVVGDLVIKYQDLGNTSEAQRIAEQHCEILQHDPPARARALLRLGRLRSEALADPVGAAEALLAALALDPTMVEAARELVKVQRGGDPTTLLESLQRLLELEVDDADRVAVLLEIGRTLESLGRDDEAIKRFTAAAQLSGRSEIVDELERCCRRAARLEVLVQTLGNLPESAGVLSRLVLLLEEMEDWQGLCRVRTRLLELSANPLERADRGYELGRLLEKLGRLREATEQYEQIAGAMAEHQPALRALQRIYRAEARVVPLIRALEQELAAVTDPGRRVELLLELGHHLVAQGRADDGAAVLEQAFELQPESTEAYWELERIYEADRPLELARVLQRRASLSTDPAKKSTLSLRAGQLLLEHGDDEATAGSLLKQAFFESPSNRDAFTSYESFLYDRGRFLELMEIYDRALRYVEEEGGRAYRPFDLYSRKGQLQLNHLGQPNEAAGSYLKAMAYDPKSESSMKMLEAIYLQQEDWLSLVRAYEHRAKLVPHNELFCLESLRQAARLATSRLPGMVEEEERIWEEVYRLDPIDEEALERLEQIYEQRDEPAKLVELLAHRAALLDSEVARIAMHFRVAALAERRLEDPERAAAAYENVRRIEEHNEIALRALARIYEATNRWPQCLAVLRDLIIVEADPDERSLLYFKCGSIVETRFGDDEEALRCYDLAVKEAPGCLPALHGLRDLHLRREDWNRALDTLELEYHLWEEERERAGILARMGEIRFQHLRDLRKAAEHFRDALTVDPECYPAALALFNIEFERGESARALSLADSLTQRMAREGDPEARSQFYCRRGQLLAGTGRLQAAAESLVVALELRPRNLEALDWLIALCRRSPDAYDFALVFRELEQVYRREGDPAAVGHVLVAAGALAEIAGDAETALSRYREAMEAAPLDLAPVRSLADLLVRLRCPEQGAAELRRLADGANELGLKRKALLRLCDVYSVACGDPARAGAVCLEVLSLEPDNQEAADRLAEEQVALGRFDEAHRTMRTLLDRLTNEGGARPRELSGYTYALGTVLLKSGDPEGAAEQFRLALQLDEANPEASMALARQHCLAGDREVAERLLRRSLTLLGEPPSPAALELWRSLAGLYLGGGRVEEAITCYQTVIRAGGRLDDRLALAEIYARQNHDTGRAVSELERIIDENSFDLQVLHLLAELCESAGQPDRALQVLKVLEMIGGATQLDRDRLQALCQEFPLQSGHPIEPGMRRVLQSAESDPHVEELWSIIREPLDALFPPEMSEHKLVPVSQTGRELLQNLVLGCCQSIGIHAAVMIAAGVPGGVLVTGDGGGRVVLDTLLLDRPLAELGFVLARSLEYLRSGHDLISRLAFDDRLLLSELLIGLLHSPEGGSDLVAEFRRGVTRKTLSQIDETVTAYQQHLAAGREEEQPRRWLAAVDFSANQHGLIVSDEIGAALRMLAQLGGQELAIGPAGEVAVQLVSDGPALVRFFLSSEYLGIRRKLARI